MKIKIPGFNRQNEFHRGTQPDPDRQRSLLERFIPATIRRPRAQLPQLNANQAVAGPNNATPQTTTAAAAFVPLALGNLGASLAVETIVPPTTTGVGTDNAAPPTTPAITRADCRDTSDSLSGWNPRKINMPPLDRNRGGQRARTRTDTVQIRALGGDELERELQQIEASMRENCPPIGGLPENASAELRRWRDKLDDTLLVFKQMRKPNKGVDALLGCYWKDQPVGLAMLTTPQDASRGLQIKFMVTHPLSAGGGSALIEHVANLSQEGKIQLSPYPDTVPVYAALGFTGDEIRGMTLDPATSPLWERHDGRWKLKKYLTKELASAMVGISTRGA